jgi:hypothetical protein
MLKAWLRRLTAPLGTLSLCGAMVFFLGCGACETHVSSCGSCKAEKVSCRDCRIDTSVSLWAPDSMGGGSLASSYFDVSGREFSYDDALDTGFHSSTCSTCGFVTEPKLEPAPINASFETRVPMEREGTLPIEWQGATPAY